MLQKRLWPKSLWDFERIRKENYYYVDKTELVWKVANEEAVVFLSRPRRFGKSMLTSTLKCYFEGKKELFEGLKLGELEAQKGNAAWPKHPVLRFDMSAGSHMSVEDLEGMVGYQLGVYEAQYNLPKSDASLGVRLQRLIATAHGGNGPGVVVIIDEYDNPLTHTVESHKAELHAAFKDILRGFYTVLKCEQERLRFVFVTGITQFQHLSLFSGLNNMMNISLSEEYSTICGITQEELDSTFGKEIAELGVKLGVSREEIGKQLKAKYDGFRFSGRGENVYNPYSLILALGTGELDNYWYNSGMPYVMPALMPGYWFDFRNLDTGIRSDKENLLQFHPGSNDPIPILYQTGYLTILDYEPELQMLTLGFPNEEVHFDFWKGLIPLALGFGESEKGMFHVRNFILSLKSGDIDGFLLSLKSLVASIPYSSLDVKNRPPRVERYQVAIYLIFQLAGKFVRAEVHSEKGRSDIEVLTADTVYIFETKVWSDKHPNTAAGAIAQIVDRQYAEPYRASGLRVVGIGMVYDGEEMVDMGWEEL